MSLPATDDFNRSDGALGSNWTGSVGDDLAIVSNQCRGGTAGINNSMYWSADAPNNDQYAELVLAATGTGQYRGPLVRASATDWVVLDADSGNSRWLIEWYNSGGWTQIGSDYSTAPSASDVGRIEVSGTDYTGKVNGTSRITGSNASAPGSGYGGIYIYGNAANGAVDDFEVGNLSADGITVELQAA